MIARHAKPFQMEWYWHCETCHRYGRFKATKGIAEQEFRRHVCLPYPPDAAA